MAGKTEGTQEAKPKRVVFITTDVQLLLDCVKNPSNILENKKTNNLTPAMKKNERKSWI
jgi:hypothetical protein